MGLLTRDERRDLIEILLKLPNIYDAQIRRSLVQSLPIAIQQSISHSASARTDIETIIASADAESAQQADGSWPIVLVIEDAIGLVAGSMLASRLQQLLDTLRTRAAADLSSPVPTSWSSDMDYVDWCSVVLIKCIEARAMSPDTRTVGVAGMQVFGLIYSEEVANRPEFWGSPPHRAVIDAIMDMKRSSLLEDSKARHYWKVTQMGLWAVKNMRVFWSSLCLPLEPEQEQVLRVVNRLSPRSTAEYAWLDWVDATTLLSELGMGNELLAAVAQELKQLGYVANPGYLGRDFRLRATYQGLVRETRCQGSP